MMKNQQEIATPKSLSVNANDANSISQKKQSPTKRITYLATFTALSFVLKMLSNALSAALPPSLKISFSYLGWYLSAAVLGPLGGGCVALVTDVLGQLVLPQGGSVNPVIAAGNFSSSLVFGLIFKYMPVKSDSLRSVIAVSASAIVGTLGINSLGLYLYYYSSMPYLAYMLTFRLPQLIPVLVNTVIFCLLLPMCKRLKKNLE